ncbi:hypothetical protein [Advenella faeciporci]|uniref:hypothetical protein n=1 Tax=Advenella faeciporci TaxID=797535 RepID=UPI00167428E5|nr:hypothetical protein [Advenella faeciporci]
MLFVATACLAGFSLGLVLAAIFLAHAQSSQPAPSFLRIHATQPWELSANGSQQRLVLRQFWQGPFWLTLQLENPFNQQMSGKLITIWPFTVGKTGWRKLRVLCHAMRWHRSLQQEAP